MIGRLNVHFVAWLLVKKATINGFEGSVSKFLSNSFDKEGILQSLRVDDFDWREHLDCGQCAKVSHIFYYLAEMKLACGMIIGSETNLVRTVLQKCYGILSSCISPPTCTRPTWLGPLSGWQSLSLRIIVIRPYAAEFFLSHRVPLFSQVATETTESEEGFISQISLNRFLFYCFKLAHVIGLGDLVLV